MSQDVARNAVRRAKRLAVVSRAAAAAAVEAMPTRPAAETAAGTVELAAVAMAVAMPAIGHVAKCSRPHARHAARQLAFRSNRVATSQCTARSASRWFVAAAAADTPSL